MRFTQSVLIFGFIMLQLTACNDGKKSQNDVGSGKAAKVNTAKETERPQSPTAPARPADPLRGTVKETMGAGGYTYLLLDTEHGDVWAAAKQMSVAVGDEVEIAGLTPMSNFRSPTLGRTFEVIQFAGGARVIGADGGTEAPQPKETTSTLPAGHPTLGGRTPAHPKSDQPSTADAIQIEKPSDGVTVAELFEKKADLTGKLVKFRGKVVKANRMILGVNWMHIQDGTGEPGSNDITVTSKSDFAEVGTVVTVEGTLGANKDFGAGYSYDLIVEDAKVIPEKE